ncbi:hypothetical protein M8818_007648 [Zalaria obscura]|uniref:Uncharacterized protein n=1 Tax=Zalaria obscura TaxID=2024903 RepID=A0ACC3S4R5_9PEZI
MSDTPTSSRERREAEVVSKHLPSGYSAEPAAVSYGTADAPAHGRDASPSGQESSLKLQGGDIHRDLYKIEARARLGQRAATFSAPPPRRDSDSETEDVVGMDAPGGFRRQFLKQNHRRLSFATAPVTSSFVDFLDLYGSFAGEDLAESDDDESAIVDHEENGRPTESRPLLGRRRTTRRQPKGDAGMTKTFFTLLKAFIGTGIMFLPKAFNNGGILFSSITLILVSLISCVAFHLLLQCREKYGGGYGDIGNAIGGPKMRKLILASITLSQIGFVCAGEIFVAENMYSFLEAVTKGPVRLTTNALIALQLAVLIPLALIRNISKLGPAALLADVCILIGLTYIYWFDIATIAQDGMHKTVQLYNPAHYTLTVGSAIFTFEGIGLILPIQSSMKQPGRFSLLLYTVMFIITIIFTAVGALSYATFGENTSTEVISNFPQDSKLVNAVQFLYSLAVLVGTPVQLFPAVRIIEGKIFGHRSGKQSNTTKWKKNAFRAGLVVVCGIIAIMGASDLDKFVALIGSFACVPLVYIYPAYLHYKGMANNKLVAAGDILLMVVGAVAMVYTTVITVATWNSG